MEAFFHHAATLNGPVIMLGLVLGLLAAAAPGRGPLHRIIFLPVVRASGHLLAVAFGALTGISLVKACEGSLSIADVLVVCMALFVVALSDTLLIGAEIVALGKLQMLNRRPCAKPFVQVTAMLILVVLSWTTATT